MRSRAVRLVMRQLHRVASILISFFEREGSLVQRHDPISARVIEIAGIPQGFGFYSLDRQT